LSLKVGVIMVFSTLKGSGCRCTEATCSRKEGGMGQWEEQHARLSRGLIHCLFCGEREGVQGSSCRCRQAHEPPGDCWFVPHLLKALEPRSPPLLLHAL
jgi:hypothetical protein